MKLYLILQCYIYYVFQFVADGVFKAELNEFLTRELAEDGYSGVEVRPTPTRTEIIIMATRYETTVGSTLIISIHIHRVVQYERTVCCF